MSQSVQRMENDSETSISIPYCKCQLPESIVLSLGRATEVTCARLSFFSCHNQLMEMVVEVAGRDELELIPLTGDWQKVELSE